MAQQQGAGGGGGSQVIYEELQKKYGLAAPVVYAGYLLGYGAKTTGKAVYDAGYQTGSNIRETAEGVGNTVNYMGLAVAAVVVAAIIAFFKK